MYYSAVQIAAGVCAALTGAAMIADTEVGHPAVSADFDAGTHYHLIRRLFHAHTHTYARALTYPKTPLNQGTLLLPSLCLPSRSHLWY